MLPTDDAAEWTESYSDVIRQLAHPSQSIVNNFKALITKRSTAQEVEATFTSSMLSLLSYTRRRISIYIYITSEFGTFCRRSEQKTDLHPLLKGLLILRSRRRR